MLHTDCYAKMPIDSLQFYIQVQRYTFICHGYWTQEFLLSKINDSIKMSTKIFI